MRKINFSHGKFVPAAQSLRVEKEMGDYCEKKTVYYAGDLSFHAAFWNASLCVFCIPESRKFI